MTADSAIGIAQQALGLVLLLSFPLLALGLVLGVMISLFQAVTQIQEMTLTFVPKMIAVFAALAYLTPWMAEKLITFTRNIFLSFPNLNS
ncbi:MAG: flagellar biosynthesis protein FliQ [Zetaproteobacteria bacterium]|nr:flagellar biosynthesis protein FliQ [Zetaproteobacteria bacterium]